MSVELESEARFGAKQHSPVGTLSFIMLDGALIADLPLTIEGATEPFHLRGKVALTADALLNKQITSTETLSLVLGIPLEDVGARVQKVASVARHAGITISRDSDHGDGYSVEVNRQRHSQSRGSRGVSSEWLSADGSPVVPGAFWSRGGRPDSGIQAAHVPAGASTQPVRRGRASQA